MLIPKATFAKRSTLSFEDHCNCHFLAYAWVNCNWLLMRVMPFFGVAPDQRKIILLHCRVLHGKKCDTSENMKSWTNPPPLIVFGTSSIVKSRVLVVRVSPRQRHKYSIMSKKRPTQTKNFAKHFMCAISFSFKWPRKRNIRRKIIAVWLNCFAWPCAVEPNGRPC